MPRARNIKPGFFANEDLAECSFPARLCFAGLWTLADREGRLEDRPKRIKGELFRFDTTDVEPLLSELAGRSFIVRYEIDGQRFIQISKFKEHQTPHYSEKPSVIKPPSLPDSDGDDDPPEPEDSESSPGKDQSLRGGRNPLIPDSGFLIPDSRKETSNLPVAPPRPPVDGSPLSLVELRKPLPDCPHLAVLALWAEALPAMPQHLPSQWRGARAEHLRARWRETADEKRWATEADGLDFFRRLFGYVGRSPFLTGRASAPVKRPFHIELEWLVTRANWDKVIEGKYHEERAA